MATQRRKTNSTFSIRIRESRESAGIVLRLMRTEEEGSFRNIFRKTREKITIRELGIDAMKARRTAGGNMLLEIQEGESGIKADKLAEKLNEALEGEATARRTSRFAEINIREFDESMNEEDIIELVAANGEDRAECSVLSESKYSEWES